jgi:predicted NUDIX family phosphoesterase
VEVLLKGSDRVNKQQLRLEEMPKFVDQLSAYSKITVDSCSAHS